MPHHDSVKASGKIVDVFHHRFVLETKDGRILADVTPKGLERFTLSVGDMVEIEGEQKPSELKVLHFSRDGRSYAIQHKEKHGPRKHPEHEHADPGAALSAVGAAGYDILAKPRRKPKHFEILGKHNGKIVELHVELDGHIRKEKPGDAEDKKWKQDA